MKKILIVVLCLIPCFTCMDIHADSQTTLVRYTVQARVVYSCRGHNLVMYLDCGSYLKEPSHDEVSGYTFIGWRNKTTGEWFDFNQPIEGNVELEAIYKKAETTCVSTGVHTNSGLYVCLGLASLIVMKKWLVK